MVKDHEQFLHLKLASGLFSRDIYLSVVYAKCDRSTRCLLWEGLLDCQPQDGSPWVVGGDFNIITGLMNILLVSLGPNLLGRIILFGNVLIECSSLLHVRIMLKLLSGLSRLVIKLKQLKAHLKWWNTEVFGNIHDKVKLLEATASHAEMTFDLVASDHNKVALSLAQANLSLGRRAKNKIFRIWEDGVALEQQDIIQESGVRFFENLLTGEHAPLNRADFGHVPSLVTVEENDNLLRPITEEEVRESVFSIHEDSAAGPDGFSAVQDFWNGSCLPKSITATTIILIPKSVDAQTWSDFRPISLCNEMVNHLNYATRGGNLIVKIDMAKAYDRVQWSFLLQMIQALGFSDVIGSRISRCISNCWFSVNINGNLSGFFASKRGLWQGDPLSPLLFVLAAEYLSRGLDFIFNRFKSMMFNTAKGIYLFDILVLRCIWGLVLQPPGTVIHRLEMICANFLWGSKNGDHKIHWISWKKVCLPFLEGGLGIRRLKDTVTTFSIKLWVRFRTVKSIWSDFLHIRYCKRYPPADFWILQRVSLTWRRMMKIRQRAEKEIGWAIGAGELSFWFDSWSLDGPLASRCPVHGLPNRLVKWFYDEREWNLEKLLSVVTQEVADQIMEVPINLTDVDRAIWLPSHNGRFSVKSAWDLVRSKAQPNGLPVDDILQARGLSLASLCLLKAVHWSGFGQVANQWGLTPRFFRKITIRMVRWIPPAVGCFKLNTDGCSKLGGDSSIGGIVRNHWRHPIVAFHDSIGQGTNNRAELLAVLKGLQICRLFNLFPLWLEVDSMISLNIIEAKVTSWELSHILTRILHILNVSNVRKSHVYREANAIADELANMGIMGSAVLYQSDIQGKLKGICRLDRIGLPYIRISSCLS
ncbi:uncharacterized protein [Henckelia pumila]|uniref:uncharacterized protein n=1 Tax=Henckelia pumila TaxID=405737 RepID=UPI003C6E1416